MIVVDAGALVDFLAIPTRTAHIASAIDDDELVAPELLDAEVISALWRMVRGGRITLHTAQLAIERLQAMPIERISHPMLDRLVWELRDRMSIQDAFYVACARLFDAQLVTTDARLARAPLPGVSILLVR